jgi:hypothetical protein
VLIEGRTWDMGTRDMDKRNTNNDRDRKWEYRKCAMRARERGGRRGLLPTYLLTYLPYLLTHWPRRYRRWSIVVTKQWPKWDTDTYMYITCTSHTGICIAYFNQATVCDIRCWRCLTRPGHATSISTYVLIKTLFYIRPVTFLGFSDFCPFVSWRLDFGTLGTFLILWFSVGSRNGRAVWPTVGIGVGYGYRITAGPGEEVFLFFLVK